MERLQESLATIYDWMGDLFESWGTVAGNAPPPPAEPAPDESD